MKSKRQLPSPRFVLPLINWGVPTLRRHKVRMSKVVTVRDLQKIARTRVPKAVYDYVEGGAHEEISLARTANAFLRVELQPNVLRDISNVDTSIEIFGKKTAMPVIFAPTGYTRMMHHTGEPAVA